MNIKGRTLELFFVDGRPDGLLVAELFNWTGHVLLVPRTQIKQALNRTETSFTGVYILLGEKDGEPLAYIGETEDISQRIRNHDTKKDWWTKAVFVTSADNKLNKAHVGYLEAKLYERAISVSRMPLDNAQKPTMPRISEAMASNMEGYLENLYMVLPAIGIDLFTQSKRPAEKPVDVNKPSDIARFELISPKSGVHAKARLEDGQFVVEAGSIVRHGWIGTQDGTYVGLRSELDRTGVILPEGKMGRFVDDYVFKSTSAAAAIATGRSANGTLEWKLVGTNKTYKDWEEDQLSEVN